MLLSVLYIIGITAEAMTGALAAGRRKMDVFGVIIIASATQLVVVPSVISYLAITP